MLAIDKGSLVQVKVKGELNAETKVTERWGISVLDLCVIAKHKQFVNTKQAIIISHMSRVKSLLMVEYCTGGL